MAAITTETTRFTRDVLGRFVCNTIEEALASADAGARSDARPFTLIIVGGGTFGAALAQEVFARDTTRRFRTLVLEGGPFLLPEHLQNLPLPGLGVPSPTSIKDLRDGGAFNGPREQVWGLPWHSATKFTGLAYCVGGRSLYWGGWSPQLLDTELQAWPANVVSDLKNTYFRQSAEQIGVTETNDFISGPLHERLRTVLRAGIDAGRVTDSVPLSQLPLVLDLASSVPAGEHDAWKLEAPLAVQSQTREGCFPCNKFSAVPLLMKASRAAYSESGGDDVRRRLMVVPNVHVTRLVTNGDRVVEVQTGGGNVRVPENGIVVLALGTVESARLAMNSFGGLPNAREMGRNLMAHLRSNLTIRVPRAALEAAGALPNEMGASALFVKGRSTLSGNTTGHFHLQITAAGLGSAGSDSEAELFKKIPDIDGFDAFRGVTDSHVVVTIRGIGEMQPNNDRSHVSLDAESDEYGVQRAFVSIEPNASDTALWEVMDRAADDVATVFAGGGAFEVRVGNSWAQVAAGKRAIEVLPFAARHDSLGSTHHETGALRIGLDPRTSVTNESGRFHSVQNAYVVGPAAFPTIGSPNPMLTGIALTRRLANQITRPSGPATESGFESLFDGTDAAFRKWQAVGPGQFNLVDGAIVAEPGNDLGLLFFAGKPFGDCTLRLQLRLDRADDNSGVFVRFRDPRLPVPDRSPGVPPHMYNNPAWVAVTTGFEIQIDQIGRPDGKRMHQTGAIYGIPEGSTAGQQASGPVPNLSPGSWHDMEIVIRGNTYTVSVNGAATATFTNTDVFRGRAPGVDSSSGYLGLQAHSGRVAFRAVRIRAEVLAASAATARGGSTLVEPRPEVPATVKRRG